MEKVNNDVRVIDVQLVGQLIPEPAVPTQRYYNSEQMIKYGVDNLYPDFLLKMYSKSPTHGAIIDNKANYVQGEGLRYVGGGIISQPLNTKEPITLTVDKLLKDFNIFNYFCVEVLYNAAGKAVQYIHVPAHLIRTNMSRSKFWYRDNWAGNIGKLIEFCPAKNYRLNDEDISTSKLFFFEGYYPSINLCYPAPEYTRGLEAIATDAAISTFNLNNIKNHFSLSTLITFFNGNNVTEDVKKKITKKITDSYSGPEGKKIIVDFQNTNGKGAEVNNIGPNEWDKAYTVTGDKCQSDIFITHQVTSPILMGVKTEGQLGGVTELELAYEIFKQTYVLNRRVMLEDAFNRLFDGSAIITGAVEFADKPLFSSKVSEQTREKIYTIDELRKLDGKDPLPEGRGNRLLIDPAKTEPLTPEAVPMLPNAPAAPATPSRIEQPTQATGAPAEPGSLEKPGKKDRTGWVYRSIKDEDFEKVKDIGLAKDLFTVIRRGKATRSRLAAQVDKLMLSREDDITQYIVNNDINGMSLDDIVKALNANGLDTDAAELQDLFSSITEAGVANIEVTDGKVSVTVNKVEDRPAGEIVTMYEYSLRSDVPGPDLIPTSRGFCRKLIGNNKYYSREDIQSMSAIFGYDVFEHAGGWWHNPETGEAEEHCRHEFVLVRLRRN